MALLAILSLIFLQTVVGVAFKNVLFIISDDMRPDLGAYSGDYAPTPVYPEMHTPHLDALAASSLLMARAYVQFPLCGPSRASFLTGRRPETTRVYDLDTYFRDAGNFTTLLQFFKQQGFKSIGMGKVFHKFEDEISWTEDFYEPIDHYGDFEESWLAVPEETAIAYPLYDQQLAFYAQERLEEISAEAVSGEQGFFMAVGFRKPHTPFIFPEQYMEHYPEEVIELAQTQSVPEDFPEVAWNTCGGLCNKIDVNETCDFNETIREDKALELRRAYYSCISYIDAMVGIVLDKLDSLGLRNNTIVVFLGDHGWQLGEHKEWCKTTNFEESLHAPAMVRVPGLTDDGIVTTKMTEFVDIFPTVVEAAGFEPVELCPLNSSSVALCREGTSLMHLIADPTHDDWKQRVFSQVDRNGKDSNSTWNNIMGFSVRNSNFRYTEWVKFVPEDNAPNWNKVEAAELYDLKGDPEETVNLANDPGHAQNVTTMSNHLHNGWRDEGIKQPE